MMNGQSVLRGIRILDFTRVLAGPYATRILADFGAEVIKVQPLLRQEEDAFGRGYYNTWNRNKLGVTLDLSKPEGVAVARRLAGISDAVVENFTPRVMANWGLDYDSLRRVKPDIIMVSMSAMGSTGPRRDYTGFGPTVQAFSGMTALASYPGGLPLGLGTSYADHVAGLTAVLALLGALEYRRRTGEGQYIDVSEVEAVVGLLGDAVLERAVGGEPPAAPCGVYRCKGDDRWCAISVFSDEEWQGFKRALGSPSWAGDGRLGTMSGRLENAGELDVRIGQWTERHTAEEVIARLQECGVAAGVVQSAADLAADPQLRGRGFFVEQDSPHGGKIVSDATPIRMSATPAAYARAAPVTGQDNDYVYRKLLGMGEGEMSGLREAGII
jgi:benzylsuccinate CoA-transferase BbsF subunit